MPPTVRPRSPSGIAIPLPEPPGRRVPLSPFDVYWVKVPPVRSVFLFRSLLPFMDVLTALRSSLERVLPAFHPFAGMLTYSPESHALSIVLPGEACSVLFVEAETDIKLDRLVEEHDQDALRQLVPDIQRDELPAPVMAVQVTELVGGVAVGLAMHHAAADGRGLLRFLEMWSVAAAGKVWAGPEPLHDRRLVRVQGDDDLASLYLQQRAPDIPRIAPKQDVQGRPLSRRTFTLAASAVRRLKQSLAAAANTTATRVSTFAAMTAHGWVSIARASGLIDNTPVFAVFLADCRAHTSPPVPGNYVGNCLALCTPSLRGSELAGPDGPAMALMAVQKAVAEVKLDPLADRTRWPTMFAAIPPGRAVILTASPSFTPYELDFGFGRPARVELDFMSHDGEIVLVAGKDPGSVQASVAIAADKMSAFRAMFDLDCDGATPITSPDVSNMKSNL